LVTGLSLKMEKGPTVSNFDKIGTFMAMQNYSGSLFHQVGLDKLFSNKPTDNTTDQISVTLHSIVEFSGNVQLLCAHAQNSFTQAMGPLAKRNPDITYAFEQNAKGLFVLKKMDVNGRIIEQDFSNDFAKLVDDNKFCRAFGGNHKSDDEKLACASLISDCLGETTYNVEKCRAKFAEVVKPTKNFRGWTKLNTDQRRYVSYRILLGLGIAGVYNKDHNLTYVDQMGEPIYSDAELQAFIPSAKDEHVKYVKTLMRTLGTIVVPNKTVNGVARPVLTNVGAPVSGMVINPRLVGVMGLTNLRGMFGNMIGGSNEEENQLTNIQYGGNMDDVYKITKNVTDKIDALKSVNPRAMPVDKEQYIRDKLTKFANLGQEVETLEKLVITYITLASQHSAKDIVFTEAEINKFKEESYRKKNQMVQKINKFEHLGKLIINKMAV